MSGKKKPKDAATGSKGKKPGKGKKPRSAQPTAAVHHGFRLMLDDDEPPAVIEPDLVHLLIHGYGTSAFVAATGARFDSPSARRESSDSMVTVGHIEWDDTEPDYTFGNLTLTAEQTAVLLGDVIVSAITRAVHDHASDLGRDTNPSDGPAPAPVDSAGSHTGCTACGTSLTPVWKHDKAPTPFQFADALWVGLFGGYGMYLDEGRDLPGSGDRVLPGNPDAEAVLCKDCADRLVHANPWLGRVLSATTEGQDT